MAKKSFQETNLSPERIPNSKFSIQKKGLPIVRCFCGFKILVVPDLKAMNQAIKNHMTEHKKIGDDLVSIDWLEKFLTEQILIIASKMNQAIA